MPRSTKNRTTILYFGYGVAVEIASAREGAARDQLASDLSQRSGYRIQIVGHDLPDRSRRGATPRPDRRRTRSRQRLHDRVAGADAARRAARCRAGRNGRRPSSNRQRSTCCGRSGAAVRRLAYQRDVRRVDHERSQRGGDRGRDQHGNREYRIAVLGSDYRQHHVPGRRWARFELHVLRHRLVRLVPRGAQRRRQDER